MTMSEFEALRTELAAFRGDMDHRFTAIDSRLATMDVKFAGIEARLANTATASTIYQAVLSMLGGAVAIIVGTIVVLKAIAIIP
jgi:hypothetical protein